MKKTIPKFAALIGNQNNNPPKWVLFLNKFTHNITTPNSIPDLIDEVSVQLLK